MDSLQANRSAYHHYPYLDKEEFSELCHHLDNRYCQATLGPVRRQWKLRVHSALDLSFGAGSKYTTFVQITRPLEEQTDLDGLESYLDSFSMSRDDSSPARDSSMAMDIEPDPVTFSSGPPFSDPVTGDLH
jgi:ubiquitin-like-conjugating enzyme ATG10